ncbi:hypothetical protein BD779DRAFT_1769124 [Infundibulicybe gibba]|nr:hypothetical protein BD779DRAFT_1769124 [Infundibulicybe gibba]
MSSSRSTQFSSGSQLEPDIERCLIQRAALASIRAQSGKMGGYLGGTIVIHPELTDVGRKPSGGACMINPSWLIQFALHAKYHLRVRWLPITIVRRPVRNEWYFGAYTVYNIYQPCAVEPNQGGKARNMCVSCTIIVTFALTSRLAPPYPTIPTRQHDSPANRQATPKLCIKTCGCPGEEVVCAIAVGYHGYYNTLRVGVDLLLVAKIRALADFGGRACIRLHDPYRILTDVEDVIFRK